MNASAKVTVLERFVLQHVLVCDLCGRLPQRTLRRDRAVEWARVHEAMHRLADQVMEPLP